MIYPFIFFAKPCINNPTQPANALAMPIRLVKIITIHLGFEMRLQARVIPEKSDRCQSNLSFFPWRFYSLRTFFLRLAKTVRDFSQIMEFCLLRVKQKPTCLQPADRNQLGCFHPFELFLSIPHSPARFSVGGAAEICG
jgi:hypothetical protein